MGLSEGTDGYIIGSLLVAGTVDLRRSWVDASLKHLAAFDVSRARSSQALLRCVNDLLTSTPS